MGAGTSGFFSSRVIPSINF